MRGTPYRIADFSAGIFTAADPVDAPYAWTASNVVADRQGKLQLRGGWTTFSTANARVAHSLHAQEYYLLMVRPNAGATNDEIIAVSSAGAETVAKSNATVNMTWEWVELNDGNYSYGMNGFDTPQKFDRNTKTCADWTASSGTLPNGKYMAVWNNKIWVAGMGSYGALSDPRSALVWCDINDPTTWPAENVTEFDPGDGEEITGLGVVGPYLLVFKRSKIWRVYDPEDSSNELISTGVGCVRHRTIASTGPPTEQKARTSRSLFFLSPYGVCVTDGLTVRPVSDAIRNEVALQVLVGENAAAGIYHDDHYYLTIGAKTFDYDLATGAWWWHTMYANQYAVWAAGGSSDIPTLYAAPTSTVGSSCSVVKAFVDGVYTDTCTSTTFDAAWYSSFLTLGAPMVRKRLLRVQVQGDAYIDLWAKGDSRTGANISRLSQHPQSSAPLNQWSFDTAYNWQIGIERDTSQATLMSIDEITLFTRVRAT